MGLSLICKRGTFFLLISEKNKHISFLLGKANTHHRASRSPDSRPWRMVNVKVGDRYNNTCPLTCAHTGKVLAWKLQSLLSRLYSKSKMEGLKKMTMV